MGSTPLTMRCSHCRKHREWDSSAIFYDRTSHEGLVPTGRAKKRATYTSGARGRPKLAFEFRHEGRSPRTMEPCNKLFWSTHPRAVDLFVKTFGEQRLEELKRKVGDFYNEHHEGGT